MKNKDFYDLKDLNFEIRSVGNTIVCLSVYSGFKENNKPIYCKHFNPMNNAETYAVLETYTKWLNEEHEPLTFEEKEYLETVIAPFKGHVVSIERIEEFSGIKGNDILYIELDQPKRNDLILPINMNSYKEFIGLELCKEYTVEELGL